MSELTTDHYRMLLGLDEDWSVDAVTFDPSGKRVVINISFAGTVDLLTTGVDVPPITNIVFVRRVKSRILFEQMLRRDQGNAQTLVDWCARRRKPPR